MKINIRVIVKVYEMTQNKEVVFLLWLLS